MSSDPQHEELQHLRLVRTAVRETSTLSAILSDSWFESMESEILKRGSGAPITDPAHLVSKLSLPGFIELLESRLSGLRGLPNKQSVAEVKLKQLGATVGTIAFRNHLFEASVLGDLAVRGVLKDIEDATTGVDGVIELAGRDVLVEVTNTTQEFRIESDAMFVSIDREVNQVIHKVAKKVSDGRQIAKAGKAPAVLFLARTRWGADELSAAEAIDRCLRNPACAALSGVVLAESWAFRCTSWYPGRSPQNPLNQAELEQMTAWYGATSAV